MFEECCAAAFRNILKRQIDAFISLVFVPSYICCLESSPDSGHLADNNGQSPEGGTVDLVRSPGGGA